MTRESEIVLRGRVVAASVELDDGVVTVVGERIAGVQSFAEWAREHPGREAPEPAGIVIPGLVDIHNHGGFGHRFDTTDPAEARAAAEYHHGQGSTTVLASIVTGAPEDMVAQTAALAGLAAEGVISGIHSEGPFLSKVRCGAQDPRYLTDPDPALIERLLDTAGGHLRVMTLAPERPGFVTAAKLLVDNGVVIALGHSDANYLDFGNALAPSGFGTLVTHLANGMPPLHHRAPGPVAAALVAAAAGRVVVELIGDGVHVDPGFGALAFATARERVALITDAMQAAGLPDGQYRLGPQEVTVSDGVARIANGSIAGGTSTLLSGLRWAIRECGVAPIDAVRAATSTPAAAAGLDGVGDLRAGHYADIVVLDRDLGLRRILRRGQWLT
ncbi:amidohydrolase family protein [Nocardia sp. NEAU-G5]|uniref:Amidohydrolase family protein n=1 Tax=Nocardia albiluteola TaxID=2842303 RepID=A0ABS6ARR8_9NOCA|nr:amidohydrolase family protein [Nocardia albiluteola]MBU3060717.1 amidohydrolase family protein [Nocardia albiluteola]